MQLPLPSSEHPQVQIETVTPDATLTTTLDKSHKVADIPLPAGTDESRVHHIAQFLNSKGQAIGEKLAWFKGSWESEAAWAEKKAQEAATAVKQQTDSIVTKTKAKVDAAVAPLKAKVDAHQTEISAAVQTAKIAAEVAG